MFLELVYVAQDTMSVGITTNAANFLDEDSWQSKDCML